MRITAFCRAIAASFLLSFCLPAPAVIDRVEQPLCGDRPPTATVEMRHHEHLDFLWVHGFGVDLAQRVTVAGIEGVRASFGRRRGGIGSAVELRFTIPADVRDGAEGRVTLHYPLGEDSFRIRVRSRPQVDSITVDAPPSGPVFFLRRDREYTVSVRGRALANLEFRPGDDMRRLASFRIEFRDGSQMRIRLRPLGTGGFNISRANFGYPSSRCIDYGIVAAPSLDQLQLRIPE